MFNEALYYFVLFSSIIPLIAIFKTKGVFALKSIIGLLIAFRFLTDFLCFYFETYLNNSNPLFHVTLPINFLLIFLVISQEISLKKIQKPIFLIVLIASFFDFSINTIVGPTSIINSVTYFLISSIGSYVIYHIEINTNIKYVIFPLTAYYSLLFFYSLFEEQICKSAELYDSFFIIVASATLLLNVTLTRGLWLKKIK
ncbi:MAG: hypothetical protein KA734_00980 [Fluviicola sp.]|nr:hypothetical protein [Fluviicola sp.]